MPLDNAAVAAMALAAAKKPLWMAPPSTTLGPLVTTQSLEAQYHPRLDVIEAALNPMSTPARTSTLDARLVWVQARKAAAETALRALNLPTTLPSSLAVTQVTNDKWPLTKAGVRVRRLSFRLRVGERASDQGEVFDTDKALAALTDSTVISTAAARADLSAQLLLQMRCLADIYERWEAAARLTANVGGSQLSIPALSNGQMLARVLAYGRIEGDLSMPPEDDTLEGTDPGADQSLVPLPPGRTRFFPFLQPSAYLFCVTYLVLPKLFAGGIDLTTASNREANGDASFTITMGGLDILWNTSMQVAAEQLFAADPPFAPTDPFDWAALNRRIPTTVTHSDALAAAKADYQTRMNLLTDRLKGPPGPDQAGRTAALGSRAYGGTYSGAAANYAALVWSEGVRYLNRLTHGPVRFGPGASTCLPEIVVYALFHQGEKAKALLSSAASHALLPQSKSTYAKALSSALRAAGLTPAIKKKLDDIRHADSATSVHLAQAGWADIAPLLGPDAVMNPLANYLRNETDSVWHSWVKPPVAGGGSPRANCIGYAQLYEYLTGQIGS